MNEDNYYAAPEADVAVEINDSQDYALAGRGDRLGAVVVDTVISTPIIFGVFYLMYVYTGSVDEYGFFEFVGTLPPVTGLAFGAVLFLVLHGYLLHRYGQTIGKRVVGISIVSAADREVLPLWKLYLLRVLPVSIVAGVPLVGSILGLIDILFIFRANRRCVHDYIAGTIVIDLDTRAAQHA